LNKFSKRDRLLKDTSKVIENGKRIRKENIVLYFYEDQVPRLSVIIGRKVGNSVLRNKFKRWTKEIFRNEKDTLNNFGIVVIYKPGADRYDFEKVKSMLNDLWLSTGIKK
jgi:ribonuclease P protein component